MEITIKPDLILKYFPTISEHQLDQFAKLYDLYSFWNAQINVISRKDIDELYERHILHSLGIAKFCSFKAGEKVLDVGTGGGFPGIPLAILFPETQFHLVAAALGLSNVKASHLRAEQVTDKYNFVVSRAVTRLVDFYPWVRGKFSKENINAIPNGILYLKGGDLTEELKESKLKAELHPLSAYFEEEFFETKFVVYIPQ
jgi:16S rRNA (guanine527-N7)-methyltransferase